MGWFHSSRNKVNLHIDLCRGIVAKIEWAAVPYMDKKRERRVDALFDTAVF
jgi:hypothetical protein